MREATTTDAINEAIALCGSVNLDCRRALFLNYEVMTACFGTTKPACLTT